MDTKTDAKDTICRTCLSEEFVQTSAFDLQLMDKELISVATMVRNCANVEVSDIFIICYCFLLEFSKFGMTVCLGY